MRPTTLLLLLHTLLMAADVSGVQISAVVEPQDGTSTNNRAAHFIWTFVSESGAAPRSGRFACGSYWVAPAAGEKGVRLLSLAGSDKPGQTDLLSLDSDPIPHAHGLVGHGRTYGSYDKEQDDLPKLPLLYTPPAGAYISLVAAMQRNEKETSGAGTKAILGGAVDAYCIVTVLADAPKDDGVNTLRPSILGDRKEILTWDDVDLSVLPAHAFIPKSGSFAKSTIRWNHSTEVFSMATWDGKEFQSYSEGGRAFRPHILHHNYAGGRGGAINASLLSLLGADNTIEEKKPLIASLISQGLDIWNLVYGRKDFPGKWSSGAGQWSGQFMPAVFAVALLKDPSKARRLMQVAADPHSRDPARQAPQEMRQIMRGVTGVLLWGDGHNPHRGPGAVVTQQDLRYWADFKGSSCYDGALKKGDPNVGKKTAGDPYGYIDGPAGTPGSAYMGVSLGGARTFAALMILFPRMRAIVNSDQVIEYVDRVARIGVWVAPDPVAAIPPEDQTERCNPWTGGKDCTAFGKTWGPRPGDARYAVEDGKGRYTSMKTKGTKGGYGNGLVDAHWDEIMALYQGQKHEDFAVPLGVAVAPDIVISPEDQDLVYLSSGTIDADIRYTLDGSQPGLGSAKYDKPFPITAKAEIRAIALKDGLKDSRVSVRAYDPAAWAAWRR